MTRLVTLKFISFTFRIVATGIKLCGGMHGGTFMWTGEMLKSPKDF